VTWVKKTRWKEGVTTYEERAAEPEMEGKSREDDEQNSATYHDARLDLRNARKRD